MPTTLCILLTSLLCLRAHAANPHQHPLLAHPPQIRNATLSDTEAITTTWLSAFHDAPHWKYGYQFMDDYPQEHHDCMYEEIPKILDHADVVTQVALLPNISEPDLLAAVGVAVRVLPTAWREEDEGDEPGRPFASSRLSTCARTHCAHRDANMTRVRDFDRQFTAARTTYLDALYPRQSQLYLAGLAVRPDYQRHGAGSALVNAGMAMGKRAYTGENVTATLIATEAGEPLYAHFGWESLRNFTMRSLDVGEDGEREGWRFDVMAKGLE